MRPSWIDVVALARHVRVVTDDDEGARTGGIAPAQLRDSGCGEADMVGPGRECESMVITGDFLAIGKLLLLSFIVMSPG